MINLDCGFACGVAAPPPVVGVGVGFCSTDLIVLLDVPPESVEPPALPPPIAFGLAALICAVDGNLFV